MWSYFRGWKRKIGVMTLAIACVLMACYLKSNQYRISLTELDRLDLPQIVRGAKTHLISKHGSVYWICTRAQHCKTLDAQITPSYSTGWLNFGVSAYDGWCTWGPQSFGLSAGHLRLSEKDKLMNAVREMPEDERKIAESIEVDVWKISYWYFIIPFTLVAAWCLLTKPGAALTATAEPFNA
jgi:hypothetical protein